MENEIDKILSYDEAEVAKVEADIAIKSIDNTVKTCNIRQNAIHKIFG